MTNNVQGVQPCLTTRTARHDQTKINILQLFYAVISRTNVDYAALLCHEGYRNAIELPEGANVPLISMDKSKIARKQSKIEQARARESEEFKKKPKIQSRSQKSQASVKS
ncbi:hypothetical protein Tco_1280986, partial [Tanacetum coccineum]